MFCSSLEPMWDLTLHTVGSPASSLTHCLVSSLALVPLFNRCGISRSTPLSGPNVLAGTCSSLQSMWDLTIHPFGSPASSLAHHPMSDSDTIPKPTANKYCPLWAFPFELLLKVLKTHMLERGFYTLIKNVSFPSPTDVGSYGPFSLKQ